MAAIYLLSNLPSSIELLCSDISNAQYGTYYIYTLSKLEEREFQQLATVVRANGSSIKAFVEGLCSVKFMGTNGFYLQSFEKELLGKLYGQVHSDAILEHTGEQLAAVIRQLCPKLSKKECPEIRYRNSAYRRAEMVARSCFASLHSGTFDSDQSSSSGPCSLKHILIVDRTFDLISPLLHEFTYEAMLRDIASSCGPEHSNEIQKELYALDNTNMKEEQAGFWSLLKDVHLADCVPTLLRYSESFIASNSAAGFSKETTGDASKLVSISQMKATIASIPELQEFKKHLLQYCVDSFNRQSLEAIATAEQDLACEYFKNEAKLTEDPLTAISSLLADKNISPENKTRLLMLYLAVVPATSQLSKAELMTLCKYSDISDTNSIAGFYDTFNVQITQRPERLLTILPTMKKKHKFKLGSMFKGNLFSKGNDGSMEKLDTESKVTYELSRFAHPVEALCKVPHMMSNFLSYHQSTLRAIFDKRSDILVESAVMEIGQTQEDLGTEEMTPSGKGGAFTTSNSVRHKQPWKTAATASDATMEVGQAMMFEPKAIIFIVGGMTSSEVKVSFERSKGHLLLGSDFFITPADFLSSLAEIGKLRRE